MPRTARPVDLALDVPPGPAPLRHRLADAVVSELRAGRLRPGDALPSTRSLAAALGLSRGPVVAAYDELAAAGFVTSRAGAGVIVAPGADDAARAGAATHVAPCVGVSPGTSPDRPAPRWDLRPGRPDTTLVDAAAWRRAWRAAASVTPGNDAGAGPPHTRLRQVLAEHLRRARGVVVDPDDLLVVPGLGGSLHAVPAALGWVGEAVALEDPGYAEAWTAFTTSGVRCVPVPVDDDGLDPALLPDDAVATYVTPSHQYPLGARMPVTRRVALLERARRTGMVVVEDDYDGEFRYDVSPLPALRSLTGAADHVVYVGTASKLVAPSLRVAWIVPPARLREPLRVAFETHGLVVNEATGLALAEFASSGALATHHARVARTYAARRAALVAAVARHLPGAPLSGVEAGLHVVLRLADDVDDLDVASRCLDAGVAVSPLSAYSVECIARGLVLCYAGLPATAADPAVRAIAGALGHRPRRRRHPNG
ncbi:MAG: PLP-dependent aminotransferase family protein [Dermatophilaceae bacterium]